MTQKYCDIKEMIKKMEKKFEKIFNLQLLL
jgi:hypothetical protein